MSNSRLKSRESAKIAQVDDICGRLCIGLHWDVEVTPQLASGFDLEVRLVSYGAPSREMTELVKDFGREKSG